MIIVTEFPITFPKLPGLGRIVDHVCRDAKGKEIVMLIDGDPVSATIIDMEHIRGGFKVTTEMEEGQHQI